MGILSDRMDYSVCIPTSRKSFLTHSTSMHIAHSEPCNIGQTETVAWNIHGEVGEGMESSDHL